ncbi:MULTISPECIES: hypothetical protein [Nocardiopsis]|uniref:Uncharacterized protein n=1 Tax=Nocardiopsis sinuspersici TaxID=501010 RepID=A0A1V3C785_9ACTN|nr:MULTISPECIES: hypothetical protein [Nocardiopsis]OOC56644.1 hypothetical protein NOSIN_24755 [Nocardiopsis sinuspersici]
MSDQASRFRNRADGDEAGDGNGAAGRIRGVAAPGRRAVQARSVVVKAGLMDDLLTGRVRVNQLKDLPV